MWVDVGRGVCVGLGVVVSFEIQEGNQGGAGSVCGGEGVVGVESSSVLRSQAKECE